MNIFFDIDYTLLAYNGSLRPGARQVLARLDEDGHDLYIWSGVGVREEEVQKVGLAEFTKGVFQKPISDYEEGLTRFGIPVRPDIVVDDHPEVVAHFGGIVIRPYFWPHVEDKEMEKVYLEIVELQRNGKE